MVVPETVRWIRHYRDKNAHIDYLLLRGINAQVILASATCVEGFAAECLKSMIPQSRPSAKLEAALADDFYSRISNAKGFSAVSDLYRVFNGATLLELLTNKRLVETLCALFAFRNCLAHGRSSECRAYHVGPEWFDFELEHSGGYRTVEDYLIKKKLLAARLTAGGSGWELLETKVADHFVDQLKPICMAIQGVLPQHVQKCVGDKMRMAFDEKQHWSDP